jgi:hypothetical protein
MRAGQLQIANTAGLLCYLVTVLCFLARLANTSALIPTLFPAFFYFLHSNSDKVYLATPPLPCFSENCFRK